MSLGTQATQLWKRSRPFRFSSIAAVLMTVLAVVSGQSWNNNTSPPQQSNPAPNNTGTPTNQQVNNQGGGGSSQQAMVQCGPAGATQLAAPLVVGNSQPRNVTAVQPSTNQAQGGVPLAVIGRFNQFIVKVDAAKVEPRRGESCANRHKAQRYQRRQRPAAGCQPP